MRADLQKYVADARQALAYYRDALPHAVFVARHAALTTLEKHSPLLEECRALYVDLREIIADLANADLARQKIMLYKRRRDAAAATFRTKKRRAIAKNDTDELIDALFGCHRQKQKRLTAAALSAARTDFRYEDGTLKAGRAHDWPTAAAHGDLYRYFVRSHHYPKRTPAMRRRIDELISDLLRIFKFFPGSTASLLRQRRNLARRHPTRFLAAYRASNTTKRASFRKRG